jgi:hypothetical protein
MGCTSSVQAISIEPSGPSDDRSPAPLPRRDSKAEASPGTGAEEAVPRPEEGDPVDGVLRPHADTHLPLTPQPPGQATANDEEEQNLYVPPMSPQKRESIERWLDLLPPPSELARDVLDNPVVPEVPETAASEHSRRTARGPPTSGGPA